MRSRHLFLSCLLMSLMGCYDDSDRPAVVPTPFPGPTATPVALPITPTPTGTPGGATPTPGVPWAVPTPTGTPGGATPAPGIPTPEPTGVPTPIPAPTFQILGTSPDQGFQAVATVLAAKIYFTEPYTGSAAKIHVTIQSQDGAIQQPTVTPAGDEATFFPELKPDTDYCMTVEIEEQDTVPAQWPLVHEACFTTRVPCGVPIDVGYDATVTGLGGNDLALTALNAMLQRYANNYPIVMLLEDIHRSTTFPVASLSAALGGWTYQANVEAKVLLPEGYSATLPDCNITSTATLTCTGTYATIPFQSDGVALHLYLSQPSLSGVLETSGDIQTMSAFTLTGAVTPENVERMEQELGVQGISERLVLDVDLDGDGVPDAASMEVQSHPRPIEMLGADCP